MGTFSPWFSGTPNYSSYAEMGSSGLSGGRPGIKQVQKEASAPVAMPHNTTNTIVQQAPQQRKQQQSPFNNAMSIAKMVRGYLDTPTDITGEGLSTPGYSLGMDLSGEEAIMQADRLETILPTQSVVTEGITAPVTEEAFNYVPGVLGEESAGLSFGQFAGPATAGLVGGKIGGYFGNWLGDKLSIGGKRERDIAGGVLGGAATGAAVGATAGGIGAIPGALLGGAGGLVASFL